MSTEKLRAMSQVAFGQRYRLELMMAVSRAEDGIVCLTDLAKELEVSPSNLQNPLKALAETGLVTPLPRSDSRRKFYLRNPSPAWTWAEQLAAMCSSGERVEQ